MSTPKRIQRKREKGWRKPEGAVDVTRPGRWGNPFHIVPVRRSGPFDILDGDRFLGQHTDLGSAQRRVVELFRDALNDPMLFGSRSQPTPAKTVIRDELAGKDLMCWCTEGDPCHGDVLLSIAAGGDGTCPPPST